MVSRRTFCVGALAGATAALLPVTESRAGSTRPVTELAVWGDSMAQVWPDYLEDMCGLPVFRGAVGGETVEEVAARFATWTRPDTGHIVWGGHVNCNRQNDTSAVVAPTIMSMSQQTPAQTGRFMPLSLTNGPESITGTALHATIVLGVNLRLQTEHPDYVDVRSYLVSNGLASARIDAAQQDYLDQGVDLPPGSLRTTKGNPSHLNTIGRMVVARRVNEMINALGWLA